MRESSTYQMILEEGRVEGEVRGRAEGRIEGRVEGQIIEARRLLLALGTRKFGPPDATTVATLEQVHDLNTLHRLADGLLQASNWQELLATVDG